MSARSEREKDRAQEMAEAMFGRGAAVSEDPGPRFTVWTPKAIAAIVLDCKGLTMTVGRRQLIREMRDYARRNER